MKRPWWLMLLRMLGAIVLYPIRMGVKIRRSATPASISLLLIGIVSMNILWGYPWIGMFAACVSTLAVGLIFNQFLRPRLHLDLSLPRCVEAGQRFDFKLHLRNRRIVPAMQLVAELKPKLKRDILHRFHSRFRNRFAAIRLPESGDSEVLSAPISISMIPPRELVTAEAAMKFERRGLQQIPELRVKSYFPFALFESSKNLSSHAIIAVTPKLMQVGDDGLNSNQLADFAGWARRIAAFDTYEYSGSREYQVGTPVRRWDFNSWARLGRPIVREFQSPGMRTVTLMVDTASNPHANTESIERVLSFAATTVTELWQRSIQVQMMITSEPVRPADTHQRPWNVTSDLESMLIRLALCNPVHPEIADEALIESINMMGRHPALLLTTRNEFPKGFDLSSLKVIQIS